jgi:hypothetical protein
MQVLNKKDGVYDAKGTRRMATALAAAVADGRASSAGR